MPAFPLTSDEIRARVARDGGASVLAEAERHGLVGLLAAAGAHPDLAPVRRRLELEDLLRDHELRRVAAALAGAGVAPVLFKGAALAYTHYDASWQRPRADVDVLVARPAREAAGHVLRGLGYAPGDLTAGRLVMQQDLWERVVAPGAIQMIDVHVEISNRAFFAARLPSSGLLARATPAPFVPGAWQLDPVDALMVSAVHQVAHHPRDRRLIWSVDVHRQAARLTAADCATLETRVRAAGVASIVAHELAQAVSDWGPGPGALAPDVIDVLAAVGQGEAARVFLDDGRGRLGDLWLDLRALPSWRDRAALVGEHLFPPVAFMNRDERGSGPRRPIAWRYARRIIRGAGRFIRR